jgi:hypothetical protein
MNSETTRLDGSDLALRGPETEIAARLASAADVDANVQRACEQFEFILANVLGLLGGDRQSRYWDLDDFTCTTFSRVADVITLEGVPNWLSGGDGCDRLRIDVALDANPLLYSYKFTNGVTNDQVLYVGKTPKGWIVNGP